MRAAMGKGDDMPAIVAMAEFISCCLVISAIYWLRHLRGAPSLLSDDMPVRYVLPALMPICVFVLGAIIIVEQQPVAHPEDSTSTVVGIALGLGVGLVALVVWLVVEVRRFRARPYTASRVNRPRPRNP